MFGHLLLGKVLSFKHIIITYNIIGLFTLFTSEKRKKQKAQEK